jgi:3-oxoacyl-[acyl-carrier protein] reductase
MSGKETDMKILENKRVIITGGSRGIGLATVKRCLEEGAYVAAAYHSSEGELNGLSNERLKVFQMDVTDKASVKDALNGALKTLGGVDVVINNAGVSDSALFMMMTDKQWDNVIQTNLYGSYYVLKQLILPMYSQRRGSVVNISSVNGLTGNAGQSNYCASKAAVIGLTKALSKELAPRNIRVNAVAPGYIETDMTSGLSEEQRRAFIGQIPMNRFGRPEEAAKAVVFLASDKASYITGQTLVVDGGML